MNKVTLQRAGRSNIGVGDEERLDGRRYPSNEGIIRGAAKLCNFSGWRTIMSRLYGPATQNGIVVADLDRDLDYWINGLGVGPFFRVDHLQTEYMIYRGQKCDVPDISVAFANWGELQIELIMPHGRAVSPYHDFLEATGGGLHHVAIWSETFDEHIALARSLGRTLECEGKVLNGCRFTYLAADGPGLPLVELTDKTPQAAAAFAHIRDAAQGWDGADPIRTLG